LSVTECTDWQLKAASREVLKFDRRASLKRSTAYPSTPVSKLGDWVSGEFAPVPEIGSNCRKSNFHLWIQRPLFGDIPWLCCACAFDARDR
jgi:hypothetical protein